MRHELRELRSDNSRAKSTPSPAENLVNTCKTVFRPVLKNSYTSKELFIDALKQAIAANDQVKGIRKKVSDDDVRAKVCGPLQKSLNDNRELVKAFGSFTLDDMRVVFNIAEKVIELKLVRPAVAVAPTVPQTLHKPQSPYYTGAAIEPKVDSDFKTLFKPEDIGKYFICKSVLNNQAPSFSLIQLASIEEDVIHCKSYLPEGGGSAMVETHSKDCYRENLKRGLLYSFYPVPQDMNNSEVTEMILASGGKSFDPKLDSEYINGVLTRGKILEPNKHYAPICIRDGKSCTVGDTWGGKLGVVSVKTASTPKVTGFDLTNDRGFNAHDRHFVFKDLTPINETFDKFLEELGYSFDRNRDTRSTRGRASFNQINVQDHTAYYDIVLLLDFSTGERAQVLARDQRITGFAKKPPLKPELYKPMDIYVNLQDIYSGETKSINLSDKDIVLIRKDRPTC